MRSPSGQRFQIEAKCLIIWDLYNVKNLIHQHHTDLRLPYRNDAKIAKICNLWTFWPVIPLINHLFKIRQKSLFARCSIDVKSATLGKKAFLSDSEEMAYWLNYRLKCPEVTDFCYFGIIPIYLNCFRFPYGIQESITKDYYKIKCVLLAEAQHRRQHSAFRSGR